MRWMAIAVALLVTTMGPTWASGAIDQITDPSELLGGPLAVEDFEDDTPEPGVSYSGGLSAVGPAHVDDFAAGGTPSGQWGLSTEFFPDTITMTFDSPMRSVGMWFGNDDTCCSGGFTANLDVYTADGLAGTVSVVANMNDFADQFIGFNSDLAVTAVTIRYGDGSDVGLYPYIDDVYFGIPEPAAGLMLGVLGLGAWRRRRV